MTTEQKFNCIFCKDVFDSKEELQVHFRKHADPKFKSNNRFDLESVVSNEKVGEKKEKSEMVSCDVCSQMFPTISKAITHKHKVHPDHDVKYFCPWCGKLFTMKHPYNIHIQTSHESLKHLDDKMFHCDCCEVDFYLPSAMLYHNKFFHRQDSDINDVGACKKLRLYNQEIIQLYYCAFCGEEYENKVNLIKHTTDDHSDENQCPEEVLKCPLCEAIFYHLDAYEIHLSFHSTDDLYSANNELFDSNLLDFSLETVPPMIVTVVNRTDLDAEAHSQDTDAESNVNALGIEQFLELAMGKVEGEGNPGKVKKKKHKKSKKAAAITLDEFLSMNQDVFGEGLDFQGVEEVPTRVVAKQFKNKKSTNIASPELEKLKEQGIVVMKVGSKKPTKLTHRKVSNKSTLKRELKTSSAVLTKLINQSNNQIKIVKRSKVNKTDTGPIQSLPAEESTVDDKDHERKSEYEEDAKVTSIDKMNATPSADTDDLATENDTKTKERLSDPSAITNTPDTPVNGSLNASFNKKIPDDDMRKVNNCTTNSSSEQKPKITLATLSPTQESKCDVEAKIINNKQGQDESDHEQSDTEVGQKNIVTDSQNMDDKEEISKIKNSSDKNNTQNSLSTLKHLSHLTIKPINQNINVSIETTTNDTSENKKDQKCSVNNDKQSPRSMVASDDEISPTKSKPNVDKDPTLDALKMLSKNITIKSLSTSTKRNIDETESDEEKSEESAMQKAIASNKNITLKKIKIEKDEPAINNKEVSGKDITLKKFKIENDETSIINKINTSNNTVKNIAKIINKITPATDIKSSKTNVDSTPNNPKKTTNSSILKHLPDITTKPLIVKKTVQLQDSQQTNAVQKETEVIEISDIDDSDDDTGKQFEPKPNFAKPPDPLKNLSKHITVKSLIPPAQPVLTSVKVERVEEPEACEDQSHAFDSDDDLPTNLKVCSQKLSNRNMAFKNALKNLGKNITVKSRTSSPNQSVKSHDHNSLDSNIGNLNDAASDSDSDVGNVKITEIETENHDENFDDNDDCDPEESDNNPIVETPYDSCSDHDEMDDTDFESEIKATTLQKVSREVTTDKNTVCLNSLKNISKSITIKSVNSSSTDTQAKPKPSQSQESLDVMKNQTKQLAIKPSQQIVKETLSENSSNSKNLKKVGKFVDQSSNESLNQKVSVNKEVTVKTFQTKTVIQEITTTVTKTIKTVNQTVNKQEARNSSQMNIPVLPQKVLGMKPPITSKNLKGVVIRHATPGVRPNKPQVNPVGTVVRPSKQITPLRPGLNMTRPSTPRMQTAKTNLPKSSPKKPVIGKPLKFSPLINPPSVVKRPIAEEISGPFSCFKKPKESLIPVSEISEFGGSGDAAVQVNAASHTSTSNYTSTSKIVKGNAVVTATQTKSEVTSMQQYSRLGNAIGTKTKNAQVQQTQVQETCDSSAMKQTTLAAIERLQKQGLLIKKPRIEVNEYSDSEHNDDNVGYSSTDEHDV